MKIVLSFVFFLFLAGVAYAQVDCIPARNESRLVYDASGVLTSEEVQSLDDKLQEFARSSSNQIAIVLVKDMCGYSPEQLATEIGDSWGLGQAKEDNGIVVLVKPEGGKGERHAFIAVGKGLEGPIPDATAYQIVQNEMLPNFRQGAFFDGLNSGTTVLMELARGEYDSNAYANKVSRKIPWQAGLIIFVIFLVIIIAGLSRVKKYAATNDVSFWVALALMNAASRNHGGSWGNFTGGSGGFGSRSGGGFGGFGGGSFGGGGAGGSW